MRAAHSLKGAARIVGLDAGVHITHAMEDCFVAAQQGDIVLDQEHIDELLRGVDLLQQMAATPEKDMERWGERKLADVTAFLDALKPCGGESAGHARDPLRASGRRYAAWTVRAARRRPLRGAFRRNRRGRSGRGT